MSPLAAQLPARRRACSWRSVLISSASLLIRAAPGPAAAVELVVDAAAPGRPIDLSRYSLGQGGLSDEPMFDAHVEEIARLRPTLIRLFVQEYFSLLPELERHSWDTLDRSVENILATGARPLMCLCFKPRVLYPEVNQDVVHPADYAAWERLVEALVRHCNDERRFGIEYWEVGNEVDIGESGGCPYRFAPADYVLYYTRTAEAIRRAAPGVKIGGPALASYQSPIGDALIEHCGRGSAPLDFFSWHMYSSAPADSRRSIRAVKEKLACFPALAGTETVSDEWNMALVSPEPAPGFQAAFILESTLGFHEEGLSRACYYHIRDHGVDPADFEWMSPSGRAFMADWWNAKPQNSGIFDRAGRRRPAYHAFQMLGHLAGEELPVAGVTAGVRALAARSGDLTNVVFWSFPPDGPGAPADEVVIRLANAPTGHFRLVTLNAAANRLDLARTGTTAELSDSPIRLTVPPYSIGWLQFGRFEARVSWGHRAPQRRVFRVQLAGSPPGVAAAERQEGWQLEPGEASRGGIWQTRAGAGDVDGIELTLDLPSAVPGPRREEHSIWSHLLEESDPDTARRLREDVAFDPAPALLTLQMDAEGTAGCSLGVEQLLLNEAMWIPELDAFVTAGARPFDFEQYARALAPLAGRRVLEQVQRGPEATYEQFKRLWADMGDPANPHPSHVVAVTWDGAIAKFGIDRTAGVSSDLGNPDRLRLAFDPGGAAWRGQRLTAGLPVLVTTFEGDGVRHDIEQFAHPLHGPPASRRGDIDMVLFERVSITNTTGEPRRLALALHHARALAPPGSMELEAAETAGAWQLVEAGSRGCLLRVEGVPEGASLRQEAVQPAPAGSAVECRCDLSLECELPPHAQREFVVKLPSPILPHARQAALAQLDYASARAATLAFWEDWLARGAVFDVPEPAVNELFRASLWHALRLPRRHGEAGPDLEIDLPYSNFAYGQTGIPWPVNHAVYVDFMLYDLRGYHAVAREELRAMYRANQEAGGHVGGFANWGVYTPSMLYAVAQHWLLSRDDAALAELLGPSLEAMDWCLAELERTARAKNPARGLVLAPLNDLSHEARAWAFNQAYFYAGLEMFGRALAELSHPRATECRAAAARLRAAIERAFGAASMRAPVVQLRDHTWIPYVPSDALAPRRLVEVWYPTDVDTGPLHLSRLGAIDPEGTLTAFMLHDHEDNLFLHGWGMANEPVYNQHATAYLRRDEATAAIRAFYSMMACAFSHTVFEPVEHRWAWGQYFGPPSTDGAWFDLYRHMLIDEPGDGSLRIAQAAPRAWLEDGKRIEVHNAPTYYGPISLRVASEAGEGSLSATVEFHGARRPRVLLVRLRHPDGAPLRAVEVNGVPWSDFDAAREWVCVPAPAAQSYRIRADYGSPAAPDDVDGLAGEVRAKGWIVFSAQTEGGDWDLFLMRPDGSDRRNITGTGTVNEAGARFSPDGQRLLYYRLPRDEPPDNNSYGTFELVIAAADGARPVSYGGESPWACWSPGGERIACLTAKGIEVIDLATRQTVEEHPRDGIVSQLVWSPDGRWFAGTANELGPYWNIARLDPAAGTITALSETERYNCTPDWAPDSRWLVYARGIIPEQGGRAELWAVEHDGRQRRFLYGESGRHIYGACVSPGGEYLLFTRSAEDLGSAAAAGPSMALIRLADTPMSSDAAGLLRERFPDARSGPRLDLGPGWEPHWTAADVGSTAAQGAPGPPAR